MSIAYIDLQTVKKHLRVSHAVDDSLIQDTLTAAIQEATDYLNKTIYLSQDDLDSAVLAGDVAEDCAVVLKTSMNRAIALLCEYHYYGPSALGAEKLQQAAQNLLQPDRYLVGY